MKYILVVVALLIFTSCCALSQVDSSVSKTPEYFISGGMAIPSLPYPFKTVWKTGFDISGGYGYSFQPGSWGYGTVSGAIEYDQFPFDRDGFIRELNLNTNVPIDGGATIAITVMATVKGTFAATKNVIAPYFLFGLGYMNVTSGEITWKGVTARPKESKSGFAYQLGAGLDIPTSERVTIFLEGKFFMGLTSSPGRQYFPIAIGARIKP